MNAVQYFNNKNGMHFAAVAPGQFSESICFFEIGAGSYARIEVTKGDHVNTAFYENIENGYRPCTYRTYKEAHLVALASLLNFFADSPAFSTPSTRPLYIDRPNCHHLINDLPF